MFGKSLGNGALIGEQHANAASLNSRFADVPIFGNPSMSVLASGFQRSSQASPDVLALSDWLKMGWSYAGTNAAEMVKMLSSRAVGIGIGNAVSRLRLAIESHQEAVSLVRGGSPNPAIAQVRAEIGDGSVLVGVSPNAFYQRASGLLLQWPHGLSVAIKTLPYVVGITKPLGVFSSVAIRNRAYSVHALSIARGKVQVSLSR